MSYQQATTEHYQPTAEQIANKERVVALWRTAKAIDPATNPATSQRFSSTRTMLPPTLNVSFTNYMMVLLQMQDVGFSGEPYLDVRTFEGWRAAGRRVRRGEKAMLWSVTWIAAGYRASQAGIEGEAADTNQTSSRKFPKLTSLFHVDQTDEVVAR